MPKSNTWIVCGELSAAVACASRSNRRSTSCASCLVARAEHLGPHQLDGRVARQQPVLGPPDLAHAAGAEQLDQVIAAELLRLAQPPAEPLQHAATAASRRTAQA